LLHSKKEILERLTVRLLEKEIIETEELAAVIENREWEGDKELHEFIDEAMKEREKEQES
jgi:mannitol/fructose-specific phosphotransferase system IIA component (Ntr-type)